MNNNTMQDDLFKVLPTSRCTVNSRAITTRIGLTERKDLLGWQKIFTFPNNYGASLISHNFSYGLELALLDENGCIIKHQEITDDVEGFLNVDAANNLLEKIAKLPKKVLTNAQNNT